jgi:pyruvate/2-oxoglutarate dehydrogenase complex dihydrolipoamide dehydrogenase (E3) component
MVERGTVGGTCVNSGCVPSKALLAAAEGRHVALDASGRFPGISTSAAPVDMAALADGKQALVEGMRADKYVDLIADYGWDLISGEDRGHGADEGSGAARRRALLRRARQRSGQGIARKSDARVACPGKRRREPAATQTNPRSWIAHRRADRAADNPNRCLLSTRYLRGCRPAPLGSLGSWRSRALPPNLAAAQFL